jgi:hypothetical protein
MHENFLIMQTNSLQPLSANFVALSSPSTVSKPTVFLQLSKNLCLCISIDVGEGHYSLNSECVVARRGFDGYYMEQSGGGSVFSMASHCLCTLRDRVSRLSKMTD